MSAPAAPGDDSIDDLRRRIAACTLCAAHLPLGPRPITRFSATARVLVIGQAPGTRVHASGIPWDDDSGDRLRGWPMTERVRAFGRFGNRIALPHPAWRARLWMARHPWFEADILPALRARIAAALARVGDT